MNQQYYQYPHYGQQWTQGYPQQPLPTPSTPSGVPSGTSGMPPGNQGQLPQEQSYIENILRLNRGKVATVYTTFENNEKWNAKVFRGEVLAAGRDHVILKDTQSERRYLILMVYVDFVTFDEPIEYSHPLHLDTYPSR